MDFIVLDSTLQLSLSPKMITIGACIAIFIFGIIVMAMLISCRKSFKGILDAFLRIEHTNNQYNENVSPEGNITKMTSSVIDYDRKLLEENRENYNKQYAEYVKWSQMIAIFPLLGILGTVAGLVFNEDSTNVDMLVSGLSLALWTTLVGLVWSIILRFIDSASTGKMVNDIDAKFNSVDGAINRQALEMIYSQAARKEL